MFLWLNNTGNNAMAMPIITEGWPGYWDIFHALLKPIL
jgi:hypothetical protein